MPADGAAHVGDIGADANIESASPGNTADGIDALLEAAPTAQETQAEAEAGKSEPVHEAEAPADEDPTAEYNRAMQTYIADIDSKESLSELKWWLSNRKKELAHELGGEESEYYQAVVEHLNQRLAAMEKKLKR